MRITQNFIEEPQNPTREEKKAKEVAKCYYKQFHANINAKVEEMEQKVREKSTNHELGNGY